ncbi:MAG TPA: DUF1697 domain-containing protein [Gaiella sp.]
MRVAALLRGINIGPHKRIAMPALRAIVESLGHTDVEMYLQSGNVVFTPAPGAPKDLVAQLEHAIADATGHDVPVVVRSGKELARVVDSSPYAVDDPTKLVVVFLAEAIELGDLSLGDLGTYLPDELTLAGRELYVSLPNRQAGSKLMEALTRRRLPTTMTVRNWRTVTALAELTSDKHEGRG